MKRQRGQSAVEFALILPMFALFLFGMIYGGAMFLQFLNLSNDSRSEARRIALMSETARHTELGGSADAAYPTGENPKSDVILDRSDSFYKVTRKVWVDVKIDEASGDVVSKDVVVRTEFERDNEDLPNVLKPFDFPPKEIAMTYRMQLEE